MKSRFTYATHCVIGLIFLAFIGLRVRVLTAPTKLMIAPETTLVLGPVRSDGTVDFEAALNDLYAKGIQPEENAVILLDQAFFPEFDSLESRVRYYHYLGTSEPLRLNCVISGDEFASLQWGSSSTKLKPTSFFYDQRGTAATRPWARTEFPDVATWLDKNEEPLKLIERASCRPKFYNPIVANGELIEYQSILHRNLRSTTRILLARAMLRVSEGDIEAASRDLLTCHRLARLATHRACVDEYRTALSIEMEIVAGEQVLLEEGLSVQQARSFLKELESLPDHQNVAETVNQGERLMSLDLIQRRWRNEKDPRLPESFPNLLPGLDINEALRQTHAYFDQQNLALNQTRLNERITKSKIAKDGLLITASRNLTDPQLIRNLFLRSRNSVSRSVAGFHLAINSLRIPSLQLASGVAETRLALIKIGFALAAYRAQSGEYPANLQSLSPNYLKFIPIDPFIEKPMHYRLLSKPHTHAQGYLLYSVGVDGTDDGGIAILDRRERDLILEVSHLFPPKP